MTDLYYSFYTTHLCTRIVVHTILYNHTGNLDVVYPGVHLIISFYNPYDPTHSYYNYIHGLYVMNR